MKRIITNSFVALSLLCTLFSCSKNDPENIFKGLNKDAIVPIDIQSVLGEDFKTDFISLESIVYRVNPALSAHEISDYACIINKPELLKEIYDGRGNMIDFSGIDFSKYSVVAGGSWFHDSWPKIGETRVIVNNEEITLYAEVVDGGGVLQSPTVAYYFNIYPKLPDSEVKVIVWDHTRSQIYGR